jgi:hypothetical protein
VQSAKPVAHGQRLIRALDTTCGHRSSLALFYFDPAIPPSHCLHRFLYSTYTFHARPPHLHAECCAEPLPSRYASLAITLSVFIGLTCGLQILRRFLYLHAPPPHLQSAAQGWGEQEIVWAGVTEGDGLGDEDAEMADDEEEVEDVGEENRKVGAARGSGEENAGVNGKSTGSANSGGSVGSGEGAAENKL